MEDVRKPGILFADFSELEKSAKGRVQFPKGLAERVAFYLGYHLG